MHPDPKSRRTKRKTAVDPSEVYCPPANRRSELFKALSKQIRGPDEKRSAVLNKTGFVLPIKGIMAAVVHVVVVADIERSSGAGVPAKQELPACI